MSRLRGAAGGRRLRRRIPLPLRHYWRTVAACAAALGLLPLLLGGFRVHPYVSSDAVDSPLVTEDIAGLVGLFDREVEHELRLTYDERDYRRMTKEYFDSGAKEYIKADLVIDGTALPDVGIRLKGNSSLAPLAPTGPRGTLQTAEPEGLPWLVRFDEFVEGRRYQGMREIVIRAGDSPLVLKEALALELMASVGLPAPKHTHARLAVNDRPRAVRLVVQHPDQRFADDLPGRGVLYEALPRSSFSDQGDDPTAYLDDFDQVNLRGSQDLQPVLDLIRWFVRSTDQELDAGLRDHVDVRSLARYLAMQDLLLNYDDVGGPGKNYYLYYDLRSKRFSVVGWDYNVAFGGDPGARPADPARASGVNRLKRRGLASPSFRAVYDAEHRALAAALYREGRAARELERLADAVRRVRGHDADALERERSSLQSVIDRRSAVLAALDRQRVRDAA